MNENPLQKVEPQYDSGLVTAIAVVGTVFGIIGMMGSFVPCLGAMALYIAIPAALISGVALGIAYYQKAKRTFAIVALTISMIGVTVAGIQFSSIAATGMGAYKGIQKEIEQEQRAREKAVRERQKRLEENKVQAEGDAP